MDFFKDRKVKKFAEKVAEKENTIFVFGSDTVTENFIKDLVRLEIGNKVALISDRDLLWVEDVKDQVTTLVEHRKDEYAKPQLYTTIGFSSAEKIIILHREGELVQSIVGQIKGVKSSTKIILIAQNAPPFIKYLSGAQRDRFVIVDNIYQVTSRLYNEMHLNLIRPAVITVPAPRKTFGSPADTLSVPNSVILRVSRKDEETGKDVLFPPNIVLEKSDRLMLYLLGGEDAVDSSFIKFFE